MIRSKHNSLASGGSAKEKVINNTQNLPPLVDDGRDDIETAVANNNTIRHSLREQQLHTSPPKIKGGFVYRLLLSFNLWMFLAIASFGLHFYRNLQTINDIPIQTNSQQNDMPVEPMIPKATKGVPNTSSSSENQSNQTKINNNATAGTMKDVSCGNHRASSCADCPQGHGKSYCNGDCKWSTTTKQCNPIKDVMAKIEKHKQWGLLHTKVLKSITLPLWLDAPKDASNNDRLGDIWLPPRLQIDHEIRSLEYGVLFCAIGNIGFAKTQVIPMIRHLHENLGIPDAQGRAALREKGVHLKSRQGFALVTTRQFVEGPLKDWVSFFDTIYLAEDLPAYPFDWQSVTNSDAMIKATKVHVMASSPFDTTVMLDLDSFPCQHDFALPLLAALGGSDIAIRNIIEEMEDVKDSRHFLGEHNSAVVVLNMKSIRTRMLLALYIQAYHRIGEIGNTKRQRDQPSLLVAMQSMAEEFTPNDGRPAEIPNDSVRAVIDRYKLGFIQHTDLDYSLVCRGLVGKTSTCGQSSSCVIVHKDPGLYKAEAKWKDAAISTKKEEGGDEEEEELIKYFGIGFKKTGTTTLDSMFSFLIDTIGGSRPSGKARVRALESLIGEGGNNTKVSLSLALARKHHYFQDAPWCNEPTRLYRQLATLHPTAKFILTIRDPEEWYRSVVNWVECSPKKCDIYGEEKMERYRRVFGAKSVSKADFIQSFVLHNEAARQYFVEELKQPHRLLEMDLTENIDGTGWVKFCEFVGLSEEQCPTGDIPHENKTPIRNEQA